MHLHFMPMNHQAVNEIYDELTDYLCQHDFDVERRETKKHIQLQQFRISKAKLLLKKFVMLSKYNNIFCKDFIKMYTKWLHFLFLGSIQYLFSIHSVSI